MIQKNAGIGNFWDALTSIADTAGQVIVSKNNSSNTTPNQYYPQATQQQYVPIAQQKNNNTILYLGIGALAVFAIMSMKKKKR